MEPENLYLRSPESPGRLFQSQGFTCLFAGLTTRFKNNLFNIFYFLKDFFNCLRERESLMEVEREKQITN